MEKRRYVLPTILNLDNHFITTPNARVINDLILDHSPEEIIDILCDVSSDRSDNIASCNCGHLSGNYYQGTKCPQCGSNCEQSLFNSIYNDMWLEIPPIMRPVLNPQAFRILSNWFGRSARRPTLYAILDMTQPSEPIVGTPFFSAMGFNWFYDNFNTIMEYYYYHHPSKNKRTTSLFIQKFIEKAGPAIWTTRLPILSKIVQPIARQSDGVRYVDPTLRSLMDAIFTLSSILLSEKMMKFSNDHIERNFFKVYQEFINYSNVIQTERLPKKPSLLRKHVFGTRYHMTGRSVIVPIVTPHDMDEIYLPWKLGTVMYKYHIISVLINHYHMTPLEAYNKISKAINLYDHDIDLIMQGLIKNCPYKGLPILINRNPTLKIGGIQLAFVTKIKPSLKSNPLPVITDNGDTDNSEGGFCVNVSIASEDQDETIINPDSYHRAMGNFHDDNQRELLNRLIDDSTIMISPMICPALNADFDGDEINLLPLTEMSEVSKFDSLRPVHRVISPSNVEVDAKDLTLSSQQFCSLTGWINDI